MAAEPKRLQGKSVNVTAAGGRARQGTVVDMPESVGERSRIGLISSGKEMVLLDGPAYPDHR